MTIQTSITIVPPAPVQAVAVPLLRKHTYDLPRRLPAHLTVTYPFVPVADLSAATETLKEITATVAPFEITLDGYGSFDRVAYLDVMLCPPLMKLVETIYTAFPALVPYDGQLGPDAVYIPHVTVGVFQTKSKQRAADLPPYPPQTFRVDRLHVGIGDDDVVLPWVIRDVVHLRG